MGKRARTPSLEDLLGRLLESATESDANRVLLEACLVHAGARAASLWGRGPRAWQPLTSLGETELLAEEARVRALLELDAPSAALRTGECLLAPPGKRLALVLAGHDGERGLDELEALLLVRESTLEPGSFELPPFPSAHDPE